MPKNSLYIKMLQHGLCVFFQVFLSFKFLKMWQDSKTTTTQTETLLKQKTVSSVDSWTPAAEKVDIVKRIEKSGAVPDKGYKFRQKVKLTRRSKEHIRRIFPASVFWFWFVFRPVGGRIHRKCAGLVQVFLYLPGCQLFPEFCLLFPVNLIQCCSVNAVRSDFQISFLCKFLPLIYYKNKCV